MRAVWGEGGTPALGRTLDLEPRSPLTYHPCHVLAGLQSSPEGKVGSWE